MKILNEIKSTTTGRRLILTRPIPAMVNREQTSTSCPEMLEVRHSLVWQAMTMIPEHSPHRDELIANNEDKVRHMVAQSIYGEAHEDLLEILLHVLENTYDLELREKIEKLMRKMK